MTAEDEWIRRALSSGEPSFSAHSTLQQLRPKMQRARLRRRAAIGTATLALLAGGSAGAFALAGSQNPPTLRTVSDDDTGASVLPEPTTVPTTTPAPAVTVAPQPVVVAPETTTSSVAPEAVGTTSPDVSDRAPGANTPVLTIAPPPPPPTPVPTATPAPAPTPAPPAPPAPAIFRTIASNCGDVVVSIENGAVRIVSITARPGYESQVSDDGPTSIEIVLRGADDKCELHAELKSGGLDVEVQNPSVGD